MRRYKLTEREGGIRKAPIAMEARCSDCPGTFRLSKNDCADVFKAAHDAAPSDLTEAVEALVRAAQALMDRPDFWDGYDHPVPGESDDVYDALSKLRTIAPDFYKQAMESDRALAEKEGRDG